MRWAIVFLDKALDLFETRNDALILGRTGLRLRGFREAVQLGPEFIEIDISHNALHPVEAFLRHAQLDDDVHMIAVVFLRGVLERGENLGMPVGTIIHQIRHLENPPVGALHQIETGHRVLALPRSQHAAR